MKATSFGNDIDLGILPGTKARLRFPHSERDKHLWICGSTGTGKSKLLEHMIREDIKQWRRHKCGLCFFDPHGSVYDSLIQWLTYFNLDLPIVPIDLRSDDWVISYNVLRQRQRADPAVLISNFVQSMAYVWGETGTERTPRFATCCSNILWALYENRLTLVEAELLINMMEGQGRRILTENLSKRAVAQAWAFLNSLSPEKFDDRVSSTVNRLYPFLGSQILRSMLGQSGVSLDLGKALEDGYIILINLATEGVRVSEEDSALFATLLLSDLWTAAKERGKGTDARSVKPFNIYIDEFQNFVTPTIAKNLDQARGFGLRLTLANQFPRQILHAGAHGPQVYDSVMVNARNKVVFEIRGEENLRPLAFDLFMGTMDPDEIKLKLESTKVMEYREEYKVVRGESVSSGTIEGTQHGSASGAGDGGTSTFPGYGFGYPLSSSRSWSGFASTSEGEHEASSHSVTESTALVPTIVPVLGKELTHVQYRSLDEQLFRAMAALGDQQQRQGVARLVGMRAPVSIFTPTVEQRPVAAERIKKYLERRYEKLPFALRGVTAQKQVEDRHHTFAGDLLKALDKGPYSARRKIK